LCQRFVQRDTALTHHQSDQSIAEKRRGKAADARRHINTGALRFQPRMTSSDITDDFQAAKVAHTSSAKICATSSPCAHALSQMLIPLSDKRLFRADNASALHGELLTDPPCRLGRTLRDRPSKNCVLRQMCPSACRRAAGCRNIAADKPLSRLSISSEARQMGTSSRQAKPRILRKALKSSALLLNVSIKTTSIEVSL